MCGPRSTVTSPLSCDQGHAPKMDPVHTSERVGGDGHHRVYVAAHARQVQVSSSVQTSVSPFKETSQCCNTLPKEVPPFMMPHNDIATRYDFEHIASSLVRYLAYAVSEDFAEDGRQLSSRR